jgi:nitrate reductase gamma subunit
MKTPDIKIENFMENRKNSNDSVNKNAKYRTSNSLLDYFLKAIVMCICLLGCMWQIASIIKLYFAYPATVFVNVQNMEKLQLPGVTLCNNNRFVFLHNLTECNFKKSNLFFIQLIKICRSVSNFYTKSQFL